MCLILKHYLLLDNQEYLEHFLKNEQGTFVNQLVELFNRNNEKPNAQWMITELFKYEPHFYLLFINFIYFDLFVVCSSLTRLLSSICNKQQAMYLLCSQQFQKLLLVDLFDLNLLNGLKAQVDLSFTQTSVLSNLFETITNLWYVKALLFLLLFSQWHLTWIIFIQKQKWNAKGTFDTCESHTHWLDDSSFAWHDIPNPLRVPFNRFDILFLLKRILIDLKNILFILKSTSSFVTLDFGKSKHQLELVRHFVWFVHKQEHVRRVSCQIDNKQSREHGICFVQLKHRTQSHMWI